jgi:hypothetical protein
VTGRTTLPIGVLVGSRHWAPLLPLPIELNTFALVGSTEVAFRWAGACGRSTTSTSISTGPNDIAARSLQGEHLRRAPRASISGDLVRYPRGR